MDAFVTRKRPKSSNDDDSDSTDVKLALLSSLHPDLDQALLLDVLLAHDGSVDEASTSLSAAFLAPGKSRSGGTRAAVTGGAQSSLRSFTTTTAATHPPSSSSSSPSHPPPAKKRTAKALSRKGRTLFLYDPIDIAEHTPCTVVHNFLPPDEANALLRELLTESETFEKITFKLFENVVSSPHTTAFFVGSFEEMHQQKYEYLYNGAKLNDVRRLTPQLEAVRPKVQEAVQREVGERIRTRYPGGQKLRHQSPDPFVPNAAFVNCYNGPQENVGWHSDQLTYLGPRAVIGSLSLGVAREFRVRRVVPRDGGGDEGDEGDGRKTKIGGQHKGDRRDKQQPEDANEGQISIHLPHNSLLVMHAEMQEEWKHCIAPAQAIQPHPVAGNRRINITYRDYKAAFHPKFTPKCKCQVPTVLRVVQRKKENWGKYFWMCHAGNVPGKTGCPFFQWAEFDEDGNPPWSAAASQGQGRPKPGSPKPSSDPETKT
ncbi:hypothetical protein RB595_001737 [Gaeumannomyces hyphopodioides]